MDIGVIGAGITGIGAAWRLAKNGHNVTLYEKEGGIGGLARSMTLDDRLVERYYHFITTYPDIAAMLTNKLIASYLGITQEFVSVIRKRRSKLKN